MQADQALNDLEQKIKELKHEYDQFFAGEIRVEPQRQRKEVRQLILAITHKHLTNTGMKFRFHSIQATFNSYQRLWDRILFEIEAGTYLPHKFKADYHVGKVDKKTGEIVESEFHKKLLARVEKAPRPLQDFKQLFEEFIEARRATREAGKVSYDSFKKSIEGQIPVLQKKLGGKIRFKIAIENGKTKIKGMRV